MTTRNVQRIFLVTIVATVLVLTGIYMVRGELRDWWRNRDNAPVPTAVTFDELQDSESTETFTEGNIDTEASEETDIEEIPAEELPDAINLNIPFTSQAPHADWGLPYQEACEEASALMAARFLQGRTIKDADDADQAILQLVDHGASLGYPIDTTAEETAHVIESFYELDVLVEDFDWERVQQALAQGYPVIVPAAGRELGNPNFTEPGPLYHMLVIKGYTGSRVITNDPGTRNGADFQYEYDVLYNAIHDWNDGNVSSGEKKMLIVRPSSQESSESS